MSENSSHPQLKLDPWAASSLLQKAIRRGDPELALQAAALFHQYRGAAIWRRLFQIAVEDVGVANLALVAEVASLATDKPLRNILGPDHTIVHDICGKLASSPKDRSADYLYSMVQATGLKLAMDPAVSRVGELVRDAAQLLDQCTVDRGSELSICGTAVDRLLVAPSAVKSPLLQNILVRAVESGAHPFTLMLLPLWSVLVSENIEVSVRDLKVSETEWLDGVPLFVFDKHTAAGKNAISRFASGNLSMRRVLSRWVPPSQRVRVAEIAAFYADAMPVSQKFRWSMSAALEDLGCRADMAIAGCQIEGITAVVKAARDNLDDLNSWRLRALCGSKR